MSTNQIVVLVLVLLVLAAVAAALVAQSRKRQRLQSTFGPEYDRTVQSSDRRRDAERELAEREQRRRQLDIRPLPAQDRRAFSERWRSTQADFVDQPEQAVRQADALVTEVMGRRGYPVGDFEQMSRDVSVDHAQVVSEYRAAHEISELNDRQQATTEQLRQAMVHYRALFTDLLSDADADDEDDDDADADLRDTGDARDDGEYRGAHAAPDDWHDDARTTDAPAYPTSAGGRTRDDQVQDADRPADDRASSERTASSHVDGVRVEQGGLHRSSAEDRDRPRA